MPLSVGSERCSEKAGKCFALFVVIARDVASQSF
jgi:hypothetical protein